MLTVPGYGEAAISISSDMADTQKIGHTIRLVGNVTNAIGRLNLGDKVGIRGPYGSPWPIIESKGKDIYIAAGGIGLPPMREDPALRVVKGGEDEKRKRRKK